MIAYRQWIVCVLLVFLGTVDNASASVTAGLKASRTSCVSPCTVVFSAEDTQDSTLPDPHQVFANLGYYFDFDDSNSGTFATSGLPKSFQKGGPLAAHTFVCSASNSKYSNGTCVFNVGVRAQNSTGTFGDAFVNVTVDTAANHFAAADTLCVSTSGTWGGDIPCPAGAQHLAQVPAVGAYTGKRILLRRGEVFGAICIGYQERNVLVEPFGNLSDNRPELPVDTDIGVDGKCGDRLPPNDTEIASYTSKWAENITFTGMRAEKFNFGMSYTHVGLHDIDMDYKNAPTGGAVNLTSVSSACLGSTTISCSKIPYPIGAYVSDLKIIGSDTDLQLVNIGAFKCPMINWLAVIGTEAWNADEHNFRTEGVWRAVLAHDAMLGHHHNAGKKHAITMRNCGYGDIDPAISLYRHSADTGTIGAPRSGNVVVADNTLSSVDSTQDTWKLYIGTTNDTSAEVGWDAVIERNKYVNSLISPSIDLALRGKYMTARIDNIYSPGNKGCTDAGPGAVPDGYYALANCAAPLPPNPTAPARSSAVPPAPVSLQVQ